MGFRLCWHEVTLVARAVRKDLGAVLSAPLHSSCSEHVALRCPPATPGTGLCTPPALVPTACQPSVSPPPRHRRSGDTGRCCPCAGTERVTREKPRVWLLSLGEGIPTREVLSVEGMRCPTPGGR